MLDKIPVLIVGAGTTGLSLAATLHAHGIPFRIIDKKSETTQTSNVILVLPRTLELWDDLRLSEEAISLGYPIRNFNLYDHNKLICNFSTENLNTIHPYWLSLPQSQIEKILHRYLKEKEIKIEFETELKQISETSSYVGAVLEKKGDKENLAVDWLIACDGVHSTIRKQLRIHFEGKDSTAHFIMGDVKISGNLPDKTLMNFFDKRGSILLIPYTTEKYRILLDISKNPELIKQNPTDDQLIKIIYERINQNIKITEIKWSSGFWMLERLIPQYKHNRIFFAGDAAHVHSPAGAQGANIGIQDTYNFAWKLAAVIKGHANLSLLNTYQTERHPTAKAILSRSIFITKIGMLSNSMLISVRNFLMKLLNMKLGTSNKFLTVISQLSINYRESRLTKEFNSREPGPRAGDRFIDCYLDQSKQDRLLNYLRGPKPTLLFFSGILKDHRNENLLKCMLDFKKIYNDLFNYVMIQAGENSITELEIKIIKDEEQLVHRAYQVSIPSLYFIRPDKYIGFRSKLSDQKRLEKYLRELYLPFISSPV